MNYGHEVSEPDKGHVTVWHFPDGRSIRLKGGRFEVQPPNGRKWHTFDTRAEALHFWAWKRLQAALPWVRLSKIAEASGVDYQRLRNAHSGRCRLTLDEIGKAWDQIQDAVR
jgi:hypothetical protein